MSRCCKATRKTPTRSITSPWSPARSGEFEEGIKLARRAISIGPPQARVHNLLGQALYRQGEPLEAIKNFDQAHRARSEFRRRPRQPRQCAGRCRLARRGAAKVSTARWRSSRTRRPTGSTAAPCCKRSAAIRRRLASFHKAVASAPDLAEAHVNRGNALKDLGQFDAGAGKTDSARFDEAEAAYSEAIKIDKTFDPAYLGRGLLRMLRGDWQRGFADYEHRSSVGAPTYTPLPDPLWDGEKRAGERARAGQRTGPRRHHPVLPLCAAARRARLRRDAAGAQGHGAAARGPARRHDRDRRRRARERQTAAALAAAVERCPACSASRPTSVPADGALSRGASRRASKPGARKLGSGGFKIGINWGPGHSNDNSTASARHSAGAICALAALPGVQLVSLQKGAAAAQIAEVPFGDKIMTLDADPDADADFFLDTAAVMMNLDLVVTCDTSVTHLAGALARPVFTAVPVIGDWRWLLGRDDSPWYPTHAAVPPGGRRPLGAGVRAHCRGRARAMAGEPRKRPVTRRSAELLPGDTSALGCHPTGSLPMSTSQNHRRPPTARRVSPRRPISAPMPPRTSPARSTRSWPTLSRSISRPRISTGT